MPLLSLLLMGEGSLSQSPAAACCSHTERAVEQFAQRHLKGVRAAVGGRVSASRSCCQRASSGPALPENLLTHVVAVGQQAAPHLRGAAADVGGPRKARRLRGAPSPAGRRCADGEQRGAGKLGHLLHHGRNTIMLHRVHKVSGCAQALGKITGKFECDGVGAGGCGDTAICSDERVRRGRSRCVDGCDKVRRYNTRTIGQRACSALHHGLQETVEYEYKRLRGKVVGNVRQRLLHCGQGQRQNDHAAAFDGAVPQVPLGALHGIELARFGLRGLALVVANDLTVRPAPCARPARRRCRLRPDQLW